MAAPLTPPPTANDLPGTSLAPQQPTPTRYRLAFGDIASLVDQERWAELVTLIERLDVTVGSGPARHDPERLFAVAPLVLTYLITHDYAPARFALLRLPPDLARGQLPQQLFNLLASATHHVYGAVYQRADALASYLSTTDTDPELAALLSKLLARFIASFRLRTLKLLRNSYTVVPLKEIQHYLGGDLASVLSLAQNSGEWAYNETTYELKPLSSGAAATSTQGSNSTLQTFHTLSSATIRLESA